MRPRCKTRSSAQYVSSTRQQYRFGVWHASLLRGAQLAASRVGTGAGCVPGDDGSVHAIPHVGGLHHGHRRAG